MLHDAFGWGGASVVQLTILPFVGVVALLFLNTDRLTTAKVGAAHH
jgi:hypothetical protein